MGRGLVNGVRSVHLGKFCRLVNIKFSRIVLVLVLHACILIHTNRTNLPKEIIAFPDFYFDSHLPSFVSHSDVGNYLQQYTDHFQLLPHIQFNTTIVSIVYNKTSYKSCVPGDRQYPESDSQRSGFIFDQWNVVTQNVHTKQTVTTVYDAILICEWYFTILYFHSWLLILCHIYSLCVLQ